MDTHFEDGNFILIGNSTPSCSCKTGWAISKVMAQICVSTMNFDWGHAFSFQCVCNWMDITLTPAKEASTENAAFNN